MKFEIEVSSTHSQAKNWILAGIKRNLTNDTHDGMLEACRYVAAELKFSFKFEEGKYKFGDKKVRSRAKDTKVQEFTNMLFEELAGV